MNRNQRDVIEYLQEEIRVLKELLGKKPALMTTNAAGWRSKANGLAANHSIALRAWSLPSQVVWRMGGQAFSQRTNFATRLSGDWLCEE